MASTSVTSTPRNTLSRENLLIRNNVIYNSLEFSPSCDADVMETESLVCPRSLQPVRKKLFQSPVTDKPNVEGEYKISSIRRRKVLKMKQNYPESTEKLQTAYIMVSEGDAYDTEKTQMKRLVSLFDNKKYAMDFA